jgi:hypothetical protein
VAQHLIKEGWWSVKWPNQDGYDLVQFVKIGSGDGVSAWGYRHKETEDLKPLSPMGVTESGFNARPAHAVTSIMQLIEETRLFGSAVFYRGHRRFEWELTPAIFRPTCKGDERSMLNDFRSRAPVRHANCPDEHDICNWLTLAQHFGLQTRLLDWTLSPLVAAYFATEPSHEDDERAGAIWVLNATKLNEVTGNGPGIFCLSMANEQVQELVRPAFDDASASPRKVLAVSPTERDTRLFVQQSVFTIHGDAKSLVEWRTELIPNEEEHQKLLVCGFIPPSSKPQIRSDLERLGIHEAALFPDLGNLARYIARDERHNKRPS